MVRADWRTQYRASPLAICRSGGAQVKEGKELERGRLGRHSPQDCSSNPDHAEQDLNPNAVVTCEVTSKARRLLAQWQFLAALLLEWPNGFVSVYSRMGPESKEDRLWARTVAWLPHGVPLMWNEEFQLNLVPSARPCIYYFNHQPCKSKCSYS